PVLNEPSPFSPGLLSGHFDPESQTLSGYSLGEVTGSSGFLNGAPPPSAPVAGQLWAGFAGNGTGNPDGHSDFRVAHLDSDGLADDQIIQEEQNASGIYQTIGLDTSAGLSITVDESWVMRITNLATGIDLTSTVVASKIDLDTLNAIAVDPV